MIESIIPNNEEHWLKLRESDITSTESSCLFNASPYCTLFELWHRKKKNLPSNFEANERTEWGLFLQDGIAAKFAKDNNWKITRKLQYIHNTNLRLGASFDYDIEIQIPREEDIHHKDIIRGLGEVKNVDSKAFKDGWIVEDDYIEAPPHIEIQVQHQMLVSALPFNYILCLVGGNRGIIIKRTPNEKIFQAIIERTKKFWESIYNNIEPKPFDVDADFICQLYNQAKPGAIFDGRGNDEMKTLVALYRKYQKEEKEAEKNKKLAKSKILPLIGDASTVWVDGGLSVSCGMVAPTIIPETKRSAYRRFTVTGKGEIANE